MRGNPRTYQGYWRQSGSRLIRNRVGLACGLLLIGLGLVGLAAPQLAGLITHRDPSQLNLRDVFAPPGPVYVLGADELGRDVLTRLIHGTRVTLGVAFLTILMSVSIGTTVGMIAGYAGHWLDEVLMRFVDMLLAIPPIFLFILLAILLRPSPLTLAGIIAFVGWTGVSRLVRAETLSVKGREFVLAAVSTGASDTRVLTHHILPNVIPIMIVAASLAMGQVILAEAALDFLGLGVSPPTSTWGNMLTQANRYLSSAPWLVVFPGLAIFVSVLASNLLGNALRDALDPRIG